MDPLIDFGREVYLPWRILEGEHLGRDFIHPYGPFSVYFNAALFAVFGVSIRTLVLANLVIFVGLVACLYRLVHRAFGFLAAAVTTAFAAIVFGMPHYGGINNYTFLAPYSHEATHGMVLLLLFLLWLGKRRDREHLSSGYVGGILVGLICLTKTEYVFVAALLVLACGFQGLRRGDLRAIGMPIAWRGALAFLGVLACTWGALALATNAKDAARVTINAVAAPIVYTAYSRSAHVQHFLGADRIGENLKHLVAWGGGALAVLGVVAVIFFLMQKAPVSDRARALFAFVTTVAAVFASWHFEWLFCATTFPALLLFGAVLVWRAAFGAICEPSGRRWNQLLFWVAATGMLARMAFDPTISHYGFFQALLAGSWLCAYLVAEYPRLPLPSGNLQAGLRWSVVGFVGVGAGLLMQRSLQFYRAKQTPVGRGADEIRGYNADVYPLVALWERTREYVAANTRPGDTLLVIPEGISLNFWTRRKHPLRITDVLPATLALNPRDAVVELAKSPPDCVVIVPRTMNELGFSRYGETAESGGTLLRWIGENFVVVAGEGDDPLVPGSLGVRILRPRPH